MRTFTCLVLTAGVLAGLAGCATYTTPIVAPPQLTPAERNYQAVWDGAIDVLREGHYTLDRQDRRAGIITTLPLTGKHWFEFWRHDAATNTDLVEGTFQTIYRAVTVTIRPTSPGAQTYTASVEVQVSRSDRPNLQLTNTSQTHTLFAVTADFDRRGDREHAAEARSRMVLHEEKVKPADVLEYDPRDIVPLGRDANLEAQLAAAIQSQASRGR